MSKRKILTAAGIAVIAVCVGFILYSASEFVNPYHNVSEIATNPAEFRGHQLQILGEVANGSLQMVGENMTFEMREGDAVLNVIYSGPTPQNFKEDISVVVIGSLNSDDVFMANEILTKCPSKYE